jgi:hypothetical protein
MIRAGSKFEKYRLKIGDVHPGNILINNEGLVKLISTCSFPREETNFDKLLENPQRKVFLGTQISIKRLNNCSSTRFNERNIQKISIHHYRSATALACACFLQGLWRMLILFILGSRAGRRSRGINSTTISSCSDKNIVAFCTHS